MKIVKNPLIKNLLTHEGLVLACVNRSEEKMVREWILTCFPAPGSDAACRGVTTEGLPAKKIITRPGRLGTVEQNPIIIREWEDGQDYSFVDDIIQKLSQIDLITVFIPSGLRVGSSLYVLVLT